MNKRTLMPLLALLVLNLNLACNSKAPAGCKSLCSLSEEQQHKTFKSYPVEKQFDLYVNCSDEKSCWRDSVSPQSYFGSWMAEDKKALPFLVERLRVEKDENIQRDIIHVLWRMASNGHLRGERYVAEAVNQVVARMKGGLIDRITGNDSEIKESRKLAKVIEDNVMA